MNSDGLRSSRLEVDVWAERAPAIVLPAPSGKGTTEAVLEVDLSGGCGADAIGRRTGTVNTARELNKDRVVVWRVVLGLATNPQVIWLAGVREERELDVAGRRRSSRNNLRRAEVRIS